MSEHSFALSVPMPDDEPRQIVCTGEEPGDNVWQPAFGTWEADDFGLDSDESVGTGERLYVSRRIYDALQARLAAAEKMAEALERAALAFNAAHLIVLCEGTPTLEALHEEMSAARAARASWEAAQ